ncbi:hypothetical protein A1507_06240 [Methylomonas koyamae]|uniref:Uncharacterized protein n=1 Tax=Methylomonas koyamae TaxID=702114 RepID=A0A177NPC4_9GAMM|nr:hypothetical protein [Methylomonas koyamae]OAI19938.1 hypothetical protein A1507_06240 [Methylomonas koyamae]
MLKHSNARKDYFPEFTGCRDAVVAQLMEAATLPAGQPVFYPGQGVRELFNVAPAALLLSDKVTKLGTDTV